MTRAGYLPRPKLDRFYAGDADLFRELVERRSPRLLAVVRPFAVDLEEAHDLLQESWRQIYEKRRSYRGSGTLLGWFYTVCRNVCMVASSRRGRRATADRSLGASADPAYESPERAAERSELGAALWRAILELPNRERDAVILRLT